MIIRILTILMILFIPWQYCRAQAFEWAKSAPVAYSLNPSYPENAVDYDKFNNRVINSRIDTVAMIYGMYALGTSYIESRDVSGQVLWDYRVGDFACVQRIVTDPAGNIFVAGVFQQNLLLGTNDSLVFITGTFISQNTFIIKLNSQGNLIWKRNLASSWPTYEGVESLAIDQNGNCWYAMTDFFLAQIVELDPGGADQMVHTIENGKRIGNMSFDPWGGLFVSGAAGFGNFVMDADTFAAPYNYNMFIARINVQGQSSWVHFGHDITFQKPMVVADGFGNAFMAGNRYDTTSFNGMFFTNPYLSSDFFAFKIDSSGSVKWGLQQPQLVMGPFGTFEQGSNLMVAADSSGKYYMGGVQRGTIDWGTGYISSTPGLTDRKIAVTCIENAGKVEWVKMGGGIYNNYMHALSVSPGGECYFTGAFRDTAQFDTITINTTNLYNFAIGKINPSLVLGVDDTEDSEVVIYPNPANDFINLPEHLLNFQVQIYDVSGKLIYSKDKVTERYLNVEKLVPGVYSLLFRNEQATMHSKLVKVK